MPRPSSKTTSQTHQRRVSTELPQELVPTRNIKRAPKPSIDSEFPGNNKRAPIATPRGSFVAENWRSGWLGRFAWGILSNQQYQLALGSADIAAMTTLNFSAATDPRNASSAYRGSSSFTRCVWEVHLGNIVRNPPHFLPFSLSLSLPLSPSPPPTLSICLSIYLSIYLSHTL
jgi:hypothetical protein